MRTNLCDQMGDPPVDLKIMKCTVQVFLIFLGLARFITAITKSEYLDIAADFELAFNLFEHIKSDIIKLDPVKYKGLRDELWTLRLLLYCDKSVLKTLCGQMKSQNDHPFDWLLNEYQISTINPWTVEIDYNDLLAGPLKTKLLQATSSAEARNSEEIRTEIERERAKSGLVFRKSAEIRSESLYKKTLSAMTNVVIKKVMQLVSIKLKLQERLGGELLSYDQIKSTYRCIPPLEREIKTLFKAKEMFNKIPSLRFKKKKTTWYTADKCLRFKKKKTAWYTADES